jgi:hypothetical protein
MSPYVISFEEYLWGGLLLAITMAIHGSGMVATLRVSDALKDRFAASESFAIGLGIVILASWMIILTNLIEVMVWALFFLVQGALPNHSIAFYDASLNYTTLQAGYLPQHWQLLEPMLGMAGMLTLAWSSGILFMLVQDFQQKQLQVRKARRARRQTPANVPPPNPSSDGTPAAVATLTTAAKVVARLQEDDLLGVRFALNVFIASIIVWIILRFFTHASPIWAIASMIASSEPVVRQGLKMFRSRLINTLVGCTVGLAFLAIGEPEPWKLPFALALTVLLASYVVRIPVMWRQAPITAAIVIAGSLSEHSKLVGAEIGLRRVAEVIFGCLVALAVSWLMSRVWPVRDQGPAPSVHA